MKIAICEDEAIFSSLLKTEVKAFFAQKSIEVHIDVFTDGTALLGGCGDGSDYSVIFMDICLENSDGMSTAAELRKRGNKSLLVFITSVENRAVEGYDVNAFGYVIKNTLEESLPKLLERLWKELSNESLLIIKDSGMTCLLRADDIISVESSGRGTIVYTYDSEYKTAENIGRLSPRLPADMFVECHKSIFVNTDKIKNIGAGSLTVINERMLPVSRRCREKVMTAIMQRVRRAGEM